MDRERLDRLMNDPSRVKREDIADLQAMTERYPWFSGAHLLLATGEHATGDLLFDEQLRTTAAHLPSRAVLFDHVTAKEDTPRVGMTVVKEVVEERPVIAEPVAPSLQPIQVEVEVEAEAEAEAIATPPLVVVPKDPPVAEEPAPPLEEPALPVAGPAAETPPPAPETDPLDLQIREAAVSSSYELTWDFEAELAAARSTPVTFEHTPPAAPVAPPPAPMEAPITPSTRKRFTDWLDLAPPADLPADLRLDQIASAPDAGDRVHAPPDTKQLIDRFIQQAAGQPVKKAEFFTPQQAAKRSLDDHTDLVSETLARVYEKQGNLAKAIATYERLALKHPDKSAYFAALSEALKARTSR
ncbi:MAG: tetratricopeptide repeat protein [Flavobacteriales bacterium]